MRKIDILQIMIGFISGLGLGDIGLRCFELFCHIIHKRQDKKIEAHKKLIKCYLAKTTIDEAHKITKIPIKQIEYEWALVKDYTNGWRKNNG